MGTTSQSGKLGSHGSARWPMVEPSTSQASHRMPASARRGIIPTSCATWVFVRIGRTLRLVRTIVEAAAASSSHAARSPRVGWA